VDTTDPLTQVTPDDVVDPSDPLSQLADIRLPEDVGLWPLAPGWWLLAVAVIGLLIYAFVLLARVLHRRRVLRHARGQLDHCLESWQQARSAGVDDNTANLDYVNAVNAVLRRVALVHFPQERVASLNGEQWLVFLRSNGDSSLLDTQTAHALAQGRFAPSCDVDAPTLHTMAGRWINSLYNARIKRDTSSNEGLAKHA
jgi:hypothetical protein